MGSSSEPIHLFRFFMTKSGRNVRHFMSYVFHVLCRCFKAMPLVEIYPNRASEVVWQTDLYRQEAKYDAAKCNHRRKM